MYCVAVFLEEKLITPKDASPESIRQLCEVPKLEAALQMVSMNTAPRPQCTPRSHQHKKSSTLSMA